MIRMIRLIVILSAVVTMLQISSNAYAATYTFLDDYDSTLDLADVIHLGDNNVPNFRQSVPYGVEITFNFDLPAIPTHGGVFTIYIDQYDSDTAGGNYNHLYVNGVDLGYLSECTSHWLTEQFSYINDILLLNNNTLTIVADEIGGNRDDFEFTNLYLNYTAIPIPATFWFLGSGLIGLIVSRRKSNKI